MAIKSIASRLRGSRRFLSGFVAGAVVGAAGAGLAALQFFRSQGAEGALTGKQPDGSAEKAVLEQFGFPLTGTEARCYTNHALSYDQAKRVPRWVLEHISKSKIMGRFFKFTLLASLFLLSLNLHLWLVLNFWVQVTLLPQPPE
ncbi:exo/endonuclease G [Homo sapiens]|uniref:Exo/endonuclease G n=1 Tax=Homo sapiens TaxID=9606 RepID=F8WE38_HUMAN|nr:exo/endonuclease G [Homo sapiens]KAI4028954.1 exo/endonuclease G [Homo sapiens]